MSTATESAQATLRQALATLQAEEARLTTELGKVRSVRASVEKALGATTKATPGGLKAAILGVLGAKPMSNGDIRAALAKAEYAHSLTPLHVTKNLIALKKAGKVRRVGTGTSSKYVVAPSK